MPDSEVTKNYAVKLLDKTDDTATVAGYGVIYGGVDLEGETFTPDTDYMLDLVPVKLVLYDHAMQQEVKHAVGTASVIPDDSGLWVEAQLNRHKKYVKEILTLVEEGVLGWSSGSVGHLIQREGKTIKRWPIVEFSLTPTPAEPRTIGVERLKALAEEHPSLKALIPQEVGETSDGATAETPKPNIQNSVVEHSRSKTMNDITITMDEYKELIKAQVKSGEPVAPPVVEEKVDPRIKALEGVVDGILDQIKNSPPLKDAGYVAPDSEEDHEETKSFGDFLLAVKNRNIRRLKSVYKTWYEADDGRKAALAEDAGATGGYAVPTQFVQAIMLAAQPYSVVRASGARIIPMSGRTAQIPVLDVETAPSAGDTAYAHGVIAYWMEEAASITESEPRFRLVELVAHKLAGYSLASNEVREDAGIIDALLADSFGAAVGSKENYAFLRGDGVGKPLGILNSGAIIAASRSAASAVALDDLGEMMSNLTPGSYGTAVWYINPDVVQKLVGLVSSPLAWLEDLRNAKMPARLLGLPVYITGALPALNTAGDILLVDPKYYLIGDRKNLTIAYSEHVNFITDQGTWRFVHRVDGQPMINGTITLENASTTVSPFCSLAAG